MKATIGKRGGQASTASALLLAGIAAASATAVSPTRATAAEATPASAALAPEPVTLQLTITGLRSSRGALRLCLWQAAHAFPNCNEASDIRRVEAPAAATVIIRLADLPPGDYAIAAIHDENDNRQLDRNLVGLPVEGVGFSRNPRLLFGPPRFAAARFHAAGSVAQTIRITYFL